MEVNGQLHASPALPKERKVLLLTQQDAVRTTEPVQTLDGRRAGVNEIVVPFTEIEPRFLGYPTRSLVTTSTELFRLHSYKHISNYRKVILQKVISLICTQAPRAVQNVSHGSLHLCIRL